MKILRDAPTLTNDGQLWMFFLGCGSAFSKRLNQNNLLIVKGQSHLLVDCGSTCSRALIQAGLSILDIRNVLITHSHADHIGGLEEMILMDRYVAKRKPKIFITPEYQNILWNQSLRGGAEMNERHNGKGLRFEDYWEIERPRKRSKLPRDARRFHIGDLSIVTFRTRHYPEQAKDWSEAMYSLGLIIDDRILFSGDTQFDPELVESFEEHFSIEKIFHDVQFFPGGIHANLQELSTLPESVRERMLLMHYGDTYENQIPAVNENGFCGLVEQQVIYEF